MGRAKIQGQLWEARAQDWAAYVEQVFLSLFGATLDAARVTSGTRLIDFGCRAGLLALLACLCGAQVAALDASPVPLAIAWKRLPGADIREGDLEELPFADARFDGGLGSQQRLLCGGYGDRYARAGPRHPAWWSGGRHGLGAAREMRVLEGHDACARATDAAPAARTL